MNKALRNIFFFYFIFFYFKLFSLLDFKWVGEYNKKAAIIPIKKYNTEKTYNKSLTFFETSSSKYLTFGLFLSVIVGNTLSGLTIFKAIILKTTEKRLSPIPFILVMIPLYFGNTYQFIYIGIKYINPNVTLLLPTYKILNKYQFSMY